MQQNKSLYLRRRKRRLHMQCMALAVLVGLCLALAIALPAHAASLYVCTDSDPLNVRYAPGSREVIGQLERGEQVTVYAMDGDWAQIVYVGDPGWVWAAYLGDAPPSEEQAGTLPAGFLDVELE